MCIRDSLRPVTLAEEYAPHLSQKMKLPVRRMQWLSADVKPLSVTLAKTVPRHSCVSILALLRHDETVAAQREHDHFSFAPSLPLTRTNTCGSVGITCNISGC
eukprot:894364-Karenia_brevis.AAC.1